MEAPKFEAFPKIARLSREIIVTEKIDGTNAQILITEDGVVYAGSRNRWLEPGKSDNHGFAGWVREHVDELLQMGPGRHFGEWWGKGIQRGYGLDHKKFSLFNVSRWSAPESRPACVDVVPTLYMGEFSEAEIRYALSRLRAFGSNAAPGFDKPEGVVIFHTADGHLYKKTIENDEKPKGKQDE